MGIPLFWWDLRNFEQVPVRTFFVRGQSNCKSAWQKRRFLAFEDTSPELGRGIQNWTDPCGKFDVPSLEKTSTLLTTEKSATKL